MQRRLSRAVVFASIILVGSSVLLARQPTRQPAFRSGVELVQVDVVVLDGNGKHVRGLTTSDFTVLDRKKPQTIAAFDEVSHERPAVTRPGPALARPARLDVGNNQTARAGRLVVMVVDDLHIYRGRTERAKDIARGILSRLGPQASMAVLFTSATRNTQVTEDRAELLAAIDTLTGRQSVRRPHQAIDTQTAAAIDPEQDIVKTLKGIDTAQETSLQQFVENLTQYKTLEEAARILGADDARRKAFVLVSEGIGKDLTGVFDGSLSPCEASPTCSMCPCYHDRALGEMMESLRRSNVTTYAIDPRGFVSPQGLALEAFPDPVRGLGDDPATGGFRWHNPIRQAQDGLKIMTEATGGFAITDTDDFTSGLERIIEDLDHYYLLGFYPSDPGRSSSGFLAGLARATGSGKDYRPLIVAVRDHPEWTVRSRKGYRPGGPPAAPVNKDPLVALSAGVLPKTDLPMRVFASVFPTDRKHARVVAALEITAPTDVLLGPDGKLRDEVSYGVLVVDEKKTKVTSRSAVAARIVLKPAASGAERPATVSYQIPVGLDLAPGKYQLRASATSSRLARGGSVYLTVEVPDFAKEAFRIAGVTLGYADGTHVPVADLPAAQRLARRDAGDGAPFPPSLDREFTPVEILRLYFEVSRRNLSSSVKTKVEILDDKDDARAWVDRQIAANDRARVDVALPLRTLAAGAYRLRITATDGANTAAEELGIVVK